MLLNEVFGGVGTTTGGDSLLAAGLLRPNGIEDDDDDTTFDDITGAVAGGVAGLIGKLSADEGRQVELVTLVVDTLDAVDPATAVAIASDLSAAAAALILRLAATCSMFRFFFSRGGEPGFVLLEGLLFGGVGALNSGLDNGGTPPPAPVGDVGEVAGLLVILLSIGICGCG